MSTSKRLLWLNGVAIIAVAIHHAAAFSLQAMFDWTDRYMPVEVPNYDQIGSPAYYVLIVLRLLLTFAGPAFFFISGYFVGITSKGQSKFSWGMVYSRIKLLIVPFIIWTIIRYILLRDLPENVGDILTPYHWIPLLIQFYLLSPIIVWLAKRNWKLMLVAIYLLGTFSSIAAYQSAFAGESSAALEASVPNWFFLFNLPFWFPFGVVMGLYLVNFKEQLFRYRRPLLAAAVIVGILILVEYTVVDWLNGPAWLGPGFSGFTKFPFSLFLILAYLAYDKSRMPVANEVAEIGTKSLGIYLGNIPFVYVTAVIMYRVTPGLLGYQLIYLAILIVVGLGGPLLLMRAVRLSPVRHQYRVLFG
jgi:peptidoglycan/LPS O-acetylase OafA/YrhL